MSNPKHTLTTLFMSFHNLKHTGNMIGHQKSAGSQAAEEEATDGEAWLKELMKVRFQKLA